MNKTHSQSSSTGSTGGSSPNYRDTRIEDGKLFYEKRWFRRGQSVQVEPKSGEKFPALISAIGTEAIWVRRTSDSSKIRIYLTQLTKGKYVLKRRTVWYRVANNLKLKGAHFKILPQIVPIFDKNA